VKQWTCGAQELRDQLLCQDRRGLILQTVRTHHPRDVLPTITDPPVEVAKGRHDNSRAVLAGGPQPLRGPKALHFSGLNPVRVDEVEYVPPTQADTVGCCQTHCVVDTDEIDDFPNLFSLQRWCIAPRE